MKKQNLYFSYFMEITKIPFLFVLVDCNWVIKRLTKPPVISNGGAINSKTDCSQTLAINNNCGTATPH